MTRRTILIGPDNNDSFHVPLRIGSLWIPGNHYHGENPGAYQIVSGERARLSSLCVLAYVAGWACENNPDGYCDPQGVGAHLIVTQADGFETNVVNVAFRDGGQSRPTFTPDHYQWFTVPGPDIWFDGPINWRVVLYNANPIARAGHVPEPADHTTHNVFGLHAAWEVESIP